MIGKQPGELLADFGAAGAGFVLPLDLLGGDQALGAFDCALPFRFGRGNRDDGVAEAARHRGTGIAVVFESDDGLGGFLTAADGELQVSGGRRLTRAGRP